MGVCDADCLLGGISCWRMGFEARGLAEKKVTPTEVNANHTVPYGYRKRLPLHFATMHLGVREN